MTTAAPAASIRRVTVDDWRLLAGLNAMFAAAFDDDDTYRRQPPGEAHAREVLSKPHVIVLVALDERGEIVGGMVAYELDKLESARREVYIYDLAVAEAHRRQGIATRLIETVQAIAHERSAWVVYVQADYGDEPAIALYTKLGAREDVMHFDLPVRATAPHDDRK
jgi:aminoglycoside 3-N-acetyltransferase I